MQKAVHDTRATFSHLQAQFQMLGTEKTSVNSNTELFNQHVQVCIKGLEVRGENIDDTLMNLFVAYEAISTCMFVSYISCCCNNYNDRKDITSDMLITQVLNKYETLHKADRWNTMSPEQDKIGDLSSEVHQLKDSNLCLSKMVKPKAKKAEKNNYQQKRPEKN